jgi:diguanylate cyclase (GGDEF)-like protein/putative nucleotidyltransferase with HDIG domain
VSSLFLLALIAVLLCLIYKSYQDRVTALADERRQASRMSELHLATVEALAIAIDAKDPTAENHIRRVQIFAAGLARALDMPENEVEGVRTAALLHDIGKLAVPEHILAKPGILSAEESQKMRSHVEVGAEIIAGVPFPYPVASLILSHHERWDGHGYPSGLRDTAIPLGARILAIVDQYDALTSDRPHRGAMTHSEALAVLRREAGHALDPNAVHTFIDILPELLADVQRHQLEAPSRATTPSSVAPAHRNSVFGDIALAHREIYALYQIAQTMGTSLGVSDTMALIAPKLENLIPFSSCALFLNVEEFDCLRCSFATGVDAPLLEALSVPNGKGVTGWVARNRRPLVNAPPAEDLEAAHAEGPTTLQSILSCPLIFGDRLIGTLAVYHTEANFYRDDHRRLLERVSEQAAAVINNSIVFERTHEDSLTDPLTGLPNTRFMFVHLTRELSRASRLNSEVSLIVMDLDDFKEINDTHGHHAGDRALREVASMLRGVIRPYDICVRYAGDEFIVVVSGCGREQAEDKRAELQHAVDSLTFEAAPGTPVPVTISAGVAVFPHDGETYESLLAKADLRMYRNKSVRKMNRAAPKGAVPQWPHPAPASVAEATHRLP